jgi:uncharacterized protein (TIGR03083 family)
MTESPWGPPLDVLPALAREEQALLDVLGDLTAEQWATPTVCTGWTVQDVASHILGDKLGLLSRGRDGQRVDVPRDDEPFPAFIDRINDEWVVACRRLSPEVLFALLVDCSTQIVDLWKRLDPDELGGPVSWAGPSPAPVWLNAAREYTEYWVHQQQIREAVGVPLLDAPEFLTPVVDTFMRALPYTLREITATKGKRVSYSVSGASGGTWTATQGPGGWTLDRRSTSRAPLASVSTDPDTFWRLCTRNVRLEDVRDRVTTKGDEETCETMLGMVSIIVSP